MLEAFDPARLYIYVLALFFGYLLGSILFGLVLTQLAGLSDIRKIGSGNIGATNVLRTGRKDIAAFTLLADILKGTLAVTLAKRWGLDAAQFAALGAFMGHLFPVWLNFRGGKGVATFLGLVLGFSWIIAAGFAAVWLAIAFITRYSSLAAICASLAAPALLWWKGEAVLAQFFLFLTVLLIAKHHENIGRLLQGAESRIKLNR